MGQELEMCFVFSIQFPIFFLLNQLKYIKVYAKAWIGRKAEHKNPGILVNLEKMPLKRKSLTVQGDFGKIISIEKTELCFVSV